MIYAENDLIPISALQHFAFCERQCALIHVERIWDENRLTAEGRILHERVHEEGSETRLNTRIVRGLRLRSLRLGLAGVMDVLEIVSDPAGTEVPGLGGRWKLHPVEFKRGRPKPDRYDEIQICSQAMCLEEMLKTTIHDGDIYYGQPRRRQAVLFDASLRDASEATALRVRALIRSGVTPSAEFRPKCLSCSLYDRCLPKTAGARKSVRRYLGQMLSP